MKKAMAFLWEMLAIGKQNIVTLDRRSASFEKKILPAPWVTGRLHFAK